jgi:hypothetical protein
MKSFKYLLALSFIFGSIHAHQSIIGKHQIVSSAKAPVYFANYEHRIVKQESNGKTLEIEDGTVWKIYSGDRAIIKDWRVDDALLVSVNSSFHSWYSGYKYVITNSNTNESIRANIHLGPYTDEASVAKRIVSIRSNKINLSDGTSWKIDYLDVGTADNWATNDCLIIGVNTSYIGSQNILINVNLDNYVKAKKRN